LSGGKPIKKITTLIDMIGKTVWVRLSFKDPEKFEAVTLREVEPAGILVQSKDITEWFLASAQKTSSPITPLLFLPFSQILCILIPEKGVSLSEKSLGL
jgi:hypothetical protein